MTAKPKSRAELVLRIFGWLHLLFFVFGLYYIGLAAYSLSTMGYFEGPPDPSAPYKRELYFIRTAINLGFLGLLLYASISLLRRTAEAVRINNILYTSMLAYFFGRAWLFEDFPLLRMSLAATGGIGEMGIGLMIVTGYPVICLVALNLARRKLRKMQAADPPPNVEPGA